MPRHHQRIKDITMAAIKEQFEIPSKLKTWSYALIGVGAVAFHHWACYKRVQWRCARKICVLGNAPLQQHLSLRLITNASMFFICATTLAMGGWQTTFRSVPEAISTMVPIFGSITFLVFMSILFSSIKMHTFINGLMLTPSEKAMTKN